MPLKQVLPALGAFALLEVSLALQGNFRREKCNMLQKSLVGMAIFLSRVKYK